MIFSSFKEANRWVFHVWYRHWILWLVLLGGVEFCNQLLTALLDGFEASQVSYLLGGLLTSTLDFTLAIMVPPVLIAVRKNEPDNLRLHLKKYFNQACIESVRSTARVCWYSFLLFVPGFVKLLRLQWVAYVVQFDPAYDAGKRDALKFSETLSKGFLLRTLIIFIALSTITLLESVRQSFPWNSPYFALAFVLTLPIRLYTQIVWFSAYEYLTARAQSAKKLEST
jgi:hypothetical protein